MHVSHQLRSINVRVHGTSHSWTTHVSCRRRKLAQPFLHVTLAKVRKPFKERIVGHGRDVEFLSEKVAQRGPVAGGKVWREGLICTPREIQPRCCRKEASALCFVLPWLVG